MASHFANTHGEPSTDRYSHRYAQEAKTHQLTSLNELELSWGRVWVPPNPYAVDLTHITSQTHHRAVTELYPRLLYTFSDVVCYVTANVKYENTYGYLLKPHLTTSQGN